MSAQALPGEKAREACREYFLGIDDPEALAALERISAGNGPAVFRAVLAGGVSRGKTRLLNSLLGADIFPESAPPTTTILTEAAYGPEPAIAWQTANGSEKLAPTAETLAEFTAGHPGADKPGILKTKWPADFLKTGIILYDTPGIDDILSGRAGIAHNALEAADAAIIVVSAANPLGLLEQSFMAGRKDSQKVAIAVAFLDTLPEADIPGQIRYIKSRAARINPGAEIWLCRACACPEGAGLIQGTEGIRQRISQWAADPALPERRARRWTAHLSSLVQASLLRQESELEIWQAKSAANEEELLAALDELEEKGEAWDCLRQEFLKKAPAASGSLLEALGQLEAEIIESMRNESPDRFAASLRGRLGEAAAQMARSLRERFAEDAADFQKRLGARLDLAELPPIDPPRDFALAYSLPSADSTRDAGLLGALVNYARLFWRDVASLLPVPPIFKDKAVDLGQMALDQLARYMGVAESPDTEAEDMVAGFFQTLSAQMEKTVSGLYADAADRMGAAQRRWLKERRAQLSIRLAPEELRRKIGTCQEGIHKGQKLLEELHRLAEGKA